MTMRKYSGKQDRLVQIQNDFTEYLKEFVEVFNNKSAIKIQAVYKYVVAEGMMKWPSFSLGTPDITQKDLLGHGEELRGVELDLTYSLHFNLAEWGEEQQDQKPLYVLDGFIEYICNNPAINDTWVFSGFGQILSNLIFEESNSFGTMIQIRLIGFIHT